MTLVYVCVLLIVGNTNMPPLRSVELDRTNELDTEADKEQIAVTTQHGQDYWLLCTC